MTRQNLVHSILPHREPPATGSSGEVYAAANVALVKYWGKRDDLLNLPVTDSLSVSLGELGTHTRIDVAERDIFTLDGKAVPEGDPFAVRLADFLDLFRHEPATRFAVHTRNTVPTAAGLASSASGFAALVKALDQLFGWQLELRHLSILARLGSGSACRSIYDGFVHWHAGQRDDGMDSFATPLDLTWPDLCIGVICISTQRKVVGSRPAMRATRQQSTLYQAWPEKVRQDLATLHTALSTGDFPLLGQVAESNALSMHATMLGAWPPILYWQPATVDALQRIWQARADGIPCYASIDAGPNIKLLFLADQSDAIRQRFPDLSIVHPFAQA